MRSEIGRRDNPTFSSDRKNNDKRITLFSTDSRSTVKIDEGEGVKTDLSLHKKCFCLNKSIRHKIVQ